MQLKEFKSLLSQAGMKRFLLQLPAGNTVPVSFHITEVGYVQKTFIDCGGTLRKLETCQLQIWVGEDIDHRIEAGKAAKILEKASAFLPSDTIDVEIEYEDIVLSQYIIAGCETNSDSIILQLAHKHTDCLAPELCKVPSKPESAQRCGPSGCC